MAKSYVRVGCKYIRHMGKVVCTVSVIEKLDSDNFLCAYNSGKTFKAHKATISTWEHLPPVKPHGKRIEQPTLVSASIAALNAEQRWMTPTEIVAALLSRGLYKFTEKAKTPHCTVSSRLNSFLSSGGNGIQKNGRGHYAASGVPAPAPAES